MLPWQRFYSVKTAFRFENVTDYKQLLNAVFVILRIIKVSVWVVSRSRRLRLITPTESHDCL